MTIRAVLPLKDCYMIEGECVGRCGVCTKDGIYAARYELVRHGPLGSSRCAAVVTAPNTKSGKAEAMNSPGKVIKHTAAFAIRSAT